MQGLYLRFAEVGSGGMCAIAWAIGQGATPVLDTLQVCVTCSTSMKREAAGLLIHVDAAGSACVPSLLRTSKEDSVACL